MRPLYSAPDGLDLWHGDCRAVLAALPADSVDVCITSPPYLGLRKYAGVEPSVWGGDPECAHEWGAEVGVINRGGGTASSTLGVLSGGHGMTDEARVKSTIVKYVSASQGSYCRLCGAWLGCLGLEPTIELYIDHLVVIFREVRRVLKPSGSAWVNLGDSYAGSGKGPSGENGFQNAETRQGGQLGYRKNKTDAPPGLKAKDLCLIPYRFALAAQADGWWVRSAITWAKKSCMPESVTDRPTCATEMIWLLTKSDRYYYDALAVRQEFDPEQEAHNQRYAREYDFGLSHDGNGQPGNENHKGIHSRPGPGGANLRNFWLLGPSPIREAHYAAFSPEIPRRAISAGSSERGCCPECGKPWERVTESKYVKSPVHGAGSVVGRHYETGSNGWDGAGYPRVNKETTTLGWSPSCPHADLVPVPATVLDPFVGSGTTLIVARQLGRRGIGIDASETYLRDIAIPRIEKQTPSLFALEVAP